MKGQGLAKLMAKENCDILGMNFTCITSSNLQIDIAAKAAAEIVKEQNENQQVADNLSSCEWYSGIINFLQKLEVPPRLTLNQAWALKLKSVKFCVIDKLLNWKDLFGVLLRFLDKEESVQVMHRFNSIICGGHN